MRIIKVSGRLVAHAGISYLNAQPSGRLEVSAVGGVLCHPDYRRRGLGRAVVFEGIRRCGELGATVAYVGTDMAFYRSLGFRKLFTANCWLKELD